MDAEFTYIFGQSGNPKHNPNVMWLDLECVLRLRVCCVRLTLCIVKMKLLIQRTAFSQSMAHNMPKNLNHEDYRFQLYELTMITSAPQDVSLFAVLTHKCA